MKHGRIGLTRPESFPKLFRVYRRSEAISESGRVTLNNSMKIIAELRCILSAAKPEERERYNQIGVSVTHSIIQRGLPAAKEQDVFVRLRNGVETRWFRVQAVHNKGEMDIDTVYYCEERSDLK